jgi:hypothetical protein
MQSVEQSAFQAVLAGSSPAIPARNSIRVRLTGRTAGSEPANRGSTPLPEAIPIWDFGIRIWDLTPGTRQIRDPHSEFPNPGWACLGSKCSQVRILLPGPFRFRIWDFGFGIGYKFPRRSCSHETNPKSHIPIPKSVRTRSPTGRGACLRNKLMKVRILPRAPPFNLGFRILDLGFQIRNAKSQIRNHLGGYSQAVQGGGLQNRKASVQIRLPAPVCLGRMQTRLHGRAPDVRLRRSPVQFRPSRDVAQ